MANRPNKTDVRTDLAQRVLKKHVGAVHVKGQISLLQRKVANVLLLNAYEDLPRADVVEHTIRVRTLADAAGFSSNDTEHLREALEGLVDLKVRWNGLARDGQEEWGVASLLAQAVVKGGTCRYAYAPDLRRKLYNPEIYARINLAVQERFGSGYALALYENCVRFRKVGTTGWISLDDWRGLLGVEDGQYGEFKYLNRGVLKPAVDEVNLYSDIRIVMETRREDRRVVALKFAVHENAQLLLELRGERSGALGGKMLPDPRELALDPQAVVASHPLVDLQTRLLTFGLSEAQALDTSTEFGADRIEGNLAYVEAELERGRAVKNVAAFTLAAIRSDYRPNEPEVVRRAASRRSADITAHPPTGAGGGTRPERPRDGAQAKRAAVEAAEREVDRARAQRLDAVWSRLTPAGQAHVDIEATNRLRAELPFLHRAYEAAKAMDVPEHDMPIAVRSTLRAHRLDVLDERSVAEQ